MRVIWLRQACRRCQPFKRTAGDISQNPEGHHRDRDRHGLFAAQPPANRHESWHRQFQKQERRSHAFPYQPGQGDDDHRIVLQGEQDSSVEQMMDRALAAAARALQAGRPKEHALGKESLPFP